MVWPRGGNGPAVGGKGEEVVGLQSANHPPRCKVPNANAVSFTLEGESRAVLRIRNVSASFTAIGVRAYPKTPVALQVIQAQAKWRKAL